jgi:hypothetical protein
MEVISFLVNVQVIPQQAEVAQEAVKATDFLYVQQYKFGCSSAISTSRLYPRRSPWYSLSEAESKTGHMSLPREPRKNPQ